jgi:hypothetical protein
MPTEKEVVLYIIGLNKEEKEEIIDFHIAFKEDTPSGMGILGSVNLKVYG